MKPIALIVLWVSITSCTTTPMTPEEEARYSANLRALGETFGSIGDSYQRTGQSGPVRCDRNFRTGQMECPR